MKELIFQYLPFLLGLFLAWWQERKIKKMLNK